MTFGRWEENLEFKTTIVRFSRQRTKLEKLYVAFKYGFM